MLTLLATSLMLDRMDSPTERPSSLKHKWSRGPKRPCASRVSLWLGMSVRGHPASGCIERLRPRRLAAKAHYGISTIVAQTEVRGCWTLLRRCSMLILGDAAGAASHTQNSIHMPRTFRHLSLSPAVLVYLPQLTWCSKAKIVRYS